MNTNNLHEGMIVKNRKELCKILEIIPKTSGKSKAIQIESFDRYFEYHREGHKYIIDCVYDEPIFNIDKREVYSNYIQSLLLYHLAREQREGKHHIIMSPLNYFQMLRMTNSKYKEGRHNPIKLSETLNIEIDYINDFYLTTYSKLKSTFMSALKQLDNKGIVLHKEEYFINIKVDEKRYHIRIMNDREIELMNQFIGKFLQDNKVTKQQVYRDNRLIKDYNSYIISSLSDILHVNVNYVYKAYKIYFNQNVSNEIDKLNEYFSINHTEISKMLNSEIVNRYKNSYINRYEKNIDILAYKIDDDIISNDIKLAIKLGYDKGHELIDHTIKIG